MPSSSRRSILQDCPAVYTDCGVCQCVPGDVCQRCPNVIALSIPAENGTDFDMSSEPTANNSEPQENGQPPHYPSEADALSCTFPTCQVRVSRLYVSVAFRPRPPASASCPVVFVLRTLLRLLGYDFGKACSGMVTSTVLVRAAELCTLDCAGPLARRASSVLCWLG